jgi:hypothetical protein
VNVSRPDTVRAPPGQGARAARPQQPRSLRPRRRDWAGTLLRPQVLLALLALGAALPYLVGAFGSRPGEAALPPLGEGGDDPLREVEMPLVIVGTDGAVRSAFATVRSADHETARLRATLEALRDVLVEEGVWPAAVGAPSAIAYDANRRRIVVVDVAVAASVVTSVAEEWAALRSLVETMRAAGADEVRVIVDGAPAATLWGAVALP